MSASSQTQSSAVSGRRNWIRHCGEKSRGMPTSCWCGERVVVRTSHTSKNPGRLFHCCPNASEEEKNHLFKWTDEAVVEEIDELKMMVGNLKRQIENLENEKRSLEDLVCGFHKEFEEMKKTVGRLDSDMEIMKNKVSMCKIVNVKNMVVCGCIVGAIYYLYFA